MIVDNYIPKIIPFIALLAFYVRWADGQTTCKNGLGRVLYERLPNQQLQGYDDDVVRDTAPPFRVLEKCQDLCLRDRTGTNNLVRTCTSFDFQPGSRITVFGGNMEYEESLCYLTSEQAGPEGIGSLMLVPNSVHFNEICLTSNRPERECPSRRYVFERHPRKKIKLPISDIKEITAANRSDCEDKCLNEFSFVCRSANFDSTMRSCALSRFTRRTHPELLEDDPNSDYLENTCLNAERRCDGLVVFVKEENKRLGGPFEVDIFNNMTLEECQAMCLRAEKYFCRSIEFDDQTKQCILSEEDSISQKDDISISSSPTHHFYDLVCLDNQRASDYPDNSVTSHLFSSGRRPDTAFQRYRNSRLGGEFHSEITGRSLSECLDECLRQTSFQCRSAVYSDRFRTCRLSRYNQKDGMRIIYDADYDYYENLMLNVVGSNNVPNENDGQGGHHSNGKIRPGERPSDSNWRNPHRGEEIYNNNRYGNNAIHPPANGHEQPAYDRYPDPNYDDYHKYGYGDLNVRGHRYPDSSDDPDGDRHRDHFSIMGPNEDVRFPYNRAPNRYPIEHYPYPYYRDSYPERDRHRYTDRLHEHNVWNPYTYDDRTPLRDRYAERYPMTNYDGRFPVNGRYHPLIESYPSAYRPLSGRYGPASDSKYNADLPHTRLYRPEDDIPLRPEAHYNRRYPSRYLPAREPIVGYTGRDAADNTFPDRRFRPSSYDSRYPPPPDSRGNVNKSPTQFNLDTRYPMDEILHGARRPEPDSAKRYTTGSIVPSVNKYPPPPPPPPLSPQQRFPLSPERYPLDASKYGSQYGNSNAGSTRPVEYAPHMQFYEMGYENRYTPYYPYGGMYDRNYDRSLGRKPPAYNFAAFGAPAQYPHYESPFHRPNYPGSGVSPLHSGVFPPHSIPGPLPPPQHPVSLSHHSHPSSSYDGSVLGNIPRPPITRCEESDNFRQIAARHKMRRHFIRRALIVPSLIQCERECIDTQDFTCRSFNYRDTAASNLNEREVPNCELSDRDSRELDVHDPNLFDSANYDFYERSLNQGDGGECMDVTQTCNEEGMEFTIRTPEGFVGRIYTYGYYDRCFFRGNGGTVNVLRITGPQGYPDCGTQKYGDTLTNIVVVQFSDNVQTSRDKRYNLTCVFRGPGEAVVTSGYIGAGSGSPIPIEYLPAENNLSSKVRLSILYQGRPTTTIAVGDPLTFRLEAIDGYNHAADIFATNVVARDPYSGRSIQLIDRFGCPVDPYVFPELDKSRNGDTLEARFNAFKIPESNFLVFEATVRTCREGCQPAYCPAPSGRQEPSFGKRRRRSLSNDKQISNEDFFAHENTTENKLKSTSDEKIPKDITFRNETRDELITSNEIESEEPEQVREMIEVYESREEIEKEGYPRKLVAPAETMCLTRSEYHGLMISIMLLVILLLTITLVSGIVYRRYRRTLSKSQVSNRKSSAHSLHGSSLRTHERFYGVGREGDAANEANANLNRLASTFRSNVSIFGGTLHKTFATGNLARMCQLPVMNPMRNSINCNYQFEDPSEPIYTDPSLFERSRSLRSLNIDVENEGEAKQINNHGQV